ncbi:MAG: NifB/NifX family molybdenum-iron cluster-binding protein [Bacteroidota bacterium]|nr:MAG: NifB/NifX family molybdenum-iron cluster-binding protein [Bacteroidota bacterium]
MKIAVPTRGNLVDDHFGHCEAYTVFTLNEQNKVEKSEILPSPQGCGCKSNIATVLREQGVKIMLAGNMGNGALNVLNNQGIQVYRGCSGDVNMLVEDFLSNQIKDSGTGCGHHHHHEEGHECKH